MRGSRIARVVLATASLLLAVPAYGQSLPPGLLGAWDVSVRSCNAAGVSVTRMGIESEQIETFGGNAKVREVEQIGDVTFVAGDFIQLEGAADVVPRTREYFRFDQRAGPDRVTFVWKDVQTVDLVRCSSGVGSGRRKSSMSAVPSPTVPSHDGAIVIRSIARSRT